MFKIAVSDHIRTRARLRYSLLAGIGFLCLAIALVWDTSLQRAHDNEMVTTTLKILSEVVTPPSNKPVENSTGRSAILQGIQEENKALARIEEEGTISASHILAHIFRDAGIALIISLVVIYLLEAANRKILNQEFESRLQEISTRTMAAVYGNDHPQSIFDAIRDGIVAQKIIRDNFHVTISLWKLDPTNGNLSPEGTEAVNQLTTVAHKSRIDPEKLLMTHVETSYLVKNISAEKQDFTPPFEMEVYFPDCGAETCRIDVIKIGTEDIKNPRCSTIGNRLSYSLPSPIVLAPQESKLISFSGYAIRYKHDDEVWCSRLITANMSAKLVDSTGLDLQLEIQSLCQTPDSDSNLNGDDRNVFLKSKGSVLPFQSFVLSWGPRPIPPKTPNVDLKQGQSQSASAPTLPMDAQA